MGEMEPTGNEVTCKECGLLLIPIEEMEKIPGSYVHPCMCMPVYNRDSFDLGMKQFVKDRCFIGRPLADQIIALLKSAQKIFTCQPDEHVNQDVQSAFQNHVRLILEEMNNLDAP